MGQSRRKKRDQRTRSRPAASPISAGLAVASESRFAIRYSTIALAIVLVVVALIRWRLRGVPFERDEGEYAYIGNLILHGGLPYRDAYNMKLPGTYVMYALLIAVFGNSPSGVHAGFAVVSLVTIVLLYAAARRLFTPVVAVVAAAIYGLLSPSPTFLGNAAHATHFINLFAVLGLYLYARFRGRLDALRAGLTGLAFGLAFLMKQPAASLVVFGGVMILAGSWPTAPQRWKATAVAALSYAVGAIAPYAVVIGIMLTAGAFGKFWFWTVTYASAYAQAKTPWPVALALFRFSFQPIFEEYPLVWLLAGAGLALMWTGRHSSSQKLLLAALTICSVAAVLPGLNFRQHYFVVLLPVVGLLSGIALEYLSGLVPFVRSTRMVHVVPLLVVALAGWSAIARGRGYYLDDPGDVISRKVYGGNPFTEAPVVARYIAAHTTANDTIGVIGSEPEILVYAGRTSATGYVYTYPIVEPQPFAMKMQQEMMAELTAARPAYLVYCNVAASWLADPSAPTDILAWFDRYARENYDIVGVVEIGSGMEPSAYYWGADARQRHPRQDSLYVLRRKGAS